MLERKNKAAEEKAEISEKRNKTLCKQTRVRSLAFFANFTFEEIYVKMILVEMKNGANIISTNIKIHCIIQSNCLSPFKVFEHYMNGGGSNG